MLNCDVNNFKYNGICTFKHVIHFNFNKFKFFSFTNKYFSTYDNYLGKSFTFID